MKIRANKNLLHDELGSIQKGQELNVTENQLSGIRRFVEVLYEKKPEAKKLSVSPAAPVSQKKTARRLKSGATNRKIDE
jgi:hypothetical protein